MARRWHTQETAELLRALATSESGLTRAEAEKRLEEYGPNKLPEGKATALPVIFLRQFRSPLIYVLVAAALIIFALGKTTDGAIILAVLVFNAIVGTIQEGRAQNTLLALKKFVETNATVIRSGREIMIPDYGVTRGDILILREGDKIPADARLIFSNNLRTDEAALTGESVPVSKQAAALPDRDLPTAEQRNMVFKGTHIVAGWGRATAVETGPTTVLGRISREIAAVETEIPLKAEIRHLAHLIMLAVAVIGLSFFISGLALGKSAPEMFTLIVSLSVSIIPEGLPIVLTLVLASGVWRMSKRHVLVKKLQAVEALGQARAILVDKTGTITKNELMIQKIYLPSDSSGKIFEVSGSGYEPYGEIKFNGKIINPSQDPSLLFTGKISAFCANARAIFLEEEQRWQVLGDPTEAALLVLSQKMGFQKDVLEKKAPLVADLPFDFKTKYHATVHELNGKKLLVVIGAPEVIFGLSETDDKQRAEWKTTLANFSEQGLRVLAMAVSYKAPPKLVPEEIRRLDFIGLLGMKDILRPEVHESLARAREAGLRVIMVTGDHKTTAQAVAREAGIWRPGDEVLTGEEVDTLTEFELAKKLDRVSVFARVTPEHKLDIAKAYKIRKEIVAMTGDGVNDSLSLVAADLGVAMGKVGTEVAKEAADIVLLDDNFGSIVSAVEEGRGIYKTIKKVILYLFSTSIGEISVIAGALFLGYPLPLLASQIIWLNFVTDGFLDVALAMEPREEGLLRGKFERPKRYLLDKLSAWRMLLMALPMMLGTLILFKGYLPAGASAQAGLEVNMMKAWTISLTTLAVFQWFNAWNCRHESQSIFRMKPLSNRFLAAATILVVFLQLLAIYNPVIQKLLKTTALGLSDWLVIIPVAASIILVEEIRKFFYRRKYH